MNRPNTTQEDSNTHPLGNGSSKESVLNIIEVAREYCSRLESEVAAQGQALKTLQESERRYREFFENAKDAIYVHDLSGRYTLINRSGEQLIGYTKEEILGMSIFDVVPEEHFKLIRENLSKKLNDHAPTMYEVDIIRKDGRRVPVEVNSSLIFEQGNPVGVQGTARDISERKQNQQILRASEERFRNLIENANDIIFTTDMSGSVTSLNRAGQRVTGYSAEEILQMNFARVVAPEHLAIAREMLSRKTVADVATVYELDLVTKSGDRAAVEISSRAIVSEGKPVGVQGVARDITERKRMEEALRLSAAQLQQSQKLEAVGQLAGGVAHDFNNLLTAIMGYSELSLRRLSPENPVTRNITEVKRAAERAASLTRQLLAFSRKQILEPRVLDLNNVVLDMHKMLRRLIGEDLNLVTRLGSGLGRVKADPGQIEQIIMNIVVNARDAMPSGGHVTIETFNVFLDDEYAREHQPVQPGEYVVMVISDTGVGMDADIQARIFEPFFTTKGPGKGTGLGLSTVYGIVKQSGGYLWVYSEVGVGTTFKIYLPRVNDLPDGEVVRPVAKPVPRGSETVLLVEDEEQVLQIAREILESLGYCVLPAANGEAALALARERAGKIDLLITDVVMPRMSGRELAERLTPWRPEMKVLYMSGYTDDATVRHGLMEERVEFIQKPFTSDALGRKVRHTLGE